jgi:hypothetical protein
LFYPVFFLFKDLSNGLLLKLFQIDYFQQNQMFGVLE